jgi:hypothetical protein
VATIAAEISAMVDVFTAILYLRKLKEKKRIKKPLQKEKASGDLIK